MKYLWSRAGRGGKDALLAELLAKTARGERCLWLVPEPYSHAAERTLAERGGAAVCLLAETVTFRRLCDRILAEGGGLAEPVLDAGGRLLLMRRALSLVAERLKSLNSFARKTGFLPSLIETLDECKRYGIAPADLERAGGEKLCDLSLIFSTYEMLCEGGAMDPHDRVTLAWEKARGFSKGIHIFVSDFISFTPQERLLLKRLHDFAASFTVLFRGEPSEKGFAPLYKTAGQLTTDNEQQTVNNGESGIHPALLHMEREWFERKPKPYAGNAEGAVEIYAASGESAETRFAAERVLRLVRDEGLRWREIGVVCSDLEVYLPLIESIFPQYDIPIFSDKMDEVADKPLPRCIRALSDCLRYGFRADDVMRLLRTGLLPLPLEETDLMENYLRRWNPRGSRFSGGSDWTRPLSGWHNEPTGAETAELERLNALRRHINRAAKILSSGKTARHCGDALRSALEELGVPQGIEVRTAALLEAGEGKLSAECGQMWEMFLKAAEQCVGILEDEPMGQEEFCELCLLVLSGYSVGSIPASLDRVHVGDQGRYPRLPVKALVYIGMSADRVPARPGAGGLLSAEERGALTQAGCEMPPDPPCRVEREFYNLYTACTLPSQKLILIYTENGKPKDDGRADAVDKLCGIFGSFPIQVPPPSLPLTPIPVPCGPLSGEHAVRLYGNTLKISASKVEAFSLCPFSYFCRYGLRAEARPESGFAPPDVGREIHAMLENCARYATERGGFHCIPREELVYFAETRAKASLEKVLRNAATPRLLAQGVRLVETGKILAGRLWDEFIESRFTPVGFEMFVEGREIPLAGLPQGTPSAYCVRGVADRVDGYRKDGTLYLRVVDYKTGSKKFSLSDVYNGLGAQMPLYLSLLANDARFGAERCEAGGMLYVQTRDLALNPDAKHSGLLLDDIEILEAMDGRLRGGAGALPVYFNKDGTLSKRSSVASAEELKSLRKRVESLAGQTARGIAEGRVDVMPLELREMPCERCDYRRACLFGGETGLDTGGDERNAPDD
jgi:ATP-dependent helicase/nuclease subunit B